MRNILVSTTAIVAIAFMFVFSSCDKEEDEGILPNITLLHGPNYVWSDQTVSMDSALTAGITASKTEDKDVLKTFNVDVFYDGHTSADSTLVNVSLTGDQGDNYTADVPIHTRSVAGTEKYVFTVINRDGLKNSVSFTLTVQ